VVSVEWGVMRKKHEEGIIQGRSGKREEVTHVVKPLRPQLLLHNYWGHSLSIFFSLGSVPTGGEGRRHLAVIATRIYKNRLLESHFVHKSLA
jgi:hypothetical protein